jgi:hypothetical protein
MAELSLADQQRLFEERHETAVRQAIYWLADPVTCEVIVAMARARLVDGYKAHGDDMYWWTVQTRRGNAFEELADCLVYVTSGEV